MNNTPEIILEKDERLEELSDKVRRGIPVSIADALSVIGYQEERKVLKKSHPWHKRIFTSGLIKNLFKG